MRIKHPFAYARGTCDETIIKKIFVDNEYSTDWCEVPVPKNPLIIDAGAHIGCASLFFADAIPSASIVAIEPALSNYERLKKNTKNLPSWQIIPIRAALSSKEGYSEVVDANLGSWGFQTRPSKVGVRNITIPMLYKAYPAFNPYIVKIDIEGAEADVFSGPIEWIDQTPIIILEPHDWLFPGKGVTTPFLRAISLFKRDFVIRGENIFSIKR